MNTKKKNKNKQKKVKIANSRKKWNMMKNLNKK